MEAHPPEEFTPQTQESTLNPLIITAVDRRDKIREALHIEKREAVYDLCRNSIALTKRELEERAKDYAVIVNGRIVQVICKECRKQFWSWA